MSRILAYTSPARGHLYPAASILAELRRRGHEVAIRTLAAEVPEMRGLGFEAAPIDPAIEGLEMDDWRARGQAAKIRRATGVFASRAAHDALDLQRAIAEVEPDAVLVDVLTLGALCAAEAWGGPRACFSPPPLPLASQAGPPMGLGMKPAKGALGRIRDRAVLAATRAGFDRLVLGELNQLRSELELMPLGHVEELFLEPPLLIYMTAEPFEYPRPDWPARIAMVGPCEWEPEGELPAELVGVDDPLVLVTNSTEAQDDGRLIAVALEALAEETVHVLATVPAGEAPLSLPANATALGFAPTDRSSTAASARSPTAAWGDPQGARPRRARLRRPLRARTGRGREAGRSIRRRDPAAGAPNATRSAAAEGARGDRVPRRGAPDSGRLRGERRRLGSGGRLRVDARRDPKASRLNRPPSFARLAAARSSHAARVDLGHRLPRWAGPLHGGFRMSSPTLTYRATCERELLVHLARLGPESRLAHYRAGVFTRHQLTLWASAYLDEVPLINDELPWIGSRLADLD
jgi:UDP:flavonoid glycosyltransferase YjiC (YdhE family)